MDINQDHSIVPSDSHFAKCFVEMKRNSKDILFNIHKHCYQKSAAEIAELALENPEKATAITRYMLVCESEGFTWGENQFELFCREFAGQSDGIDFEERKLLLEAVVNEVTLAFNHSPNIETQKICKEMLDMFDIEDELINKKIFIDRSRAEHFSNRIEIIDHTIKKQDCVTGLGSWNLYGLPGHFPN